MNYSSGNDWQSDLRKRIEDQQRFTYVVNPRTCPVCHSTDITRIPSKGRLTGVFKNSEKPRIWCNSCGYRF